jgi:hypothetical protein
MRKLLTLLAVGVMFSGLSFLRADEKGTPVTLKGDGMCAKCGLKAADAKKCQNVVVVTKGDKKTVYYLTGKLSDGVHKSMGFCSASKDEPVKIEVKGNCEKKDDKLVVTVTSDIKKID